MTPGPACLIMQDHWGGLPWRSCATRHAQPSQGSVGSKNCFFLQPAHSAHMLLQGRGHLFQR